MSRAHHQVRIIRVFHHPVVLMYGAEARGNDDIRGGADDGPLDYACVNERDLGYYVPQLSDMATVSKIVDEPIKDVVWYVHWQKMIPQGGTDNSERPRLNHSCPRPGNKEVPSIQRAKWMLRCGGEG